MQPLVASLVAGSIALLPRPLAASSDLRSDLAAQPSCSITASSPRGQYRLYCLLLRRSGHSCRAHCVGCLSRTPPHRLYHLPYFRRPYPLEHIPSNNFHCSYSLENILGALGKAIHHSINTSCAARAAADHRLNRLHRLYRAAAAAGATLGQLGGSLTAVAVAKGLLPEGSGTSKAVLSPLLLSSSILMWVTRVWTVWSHSFVGCIVYIAWSCGHVVTSWSCPVMSG